MATMTSSSYHHNPLHSTTILFIPPQSQWPTVDYWVADIAMIKVDYRVAEKPTGIHQVSNTLRLVIGTGGVVDESAKFGNIVNQPANSEAPPTDRQTRRHSRRIGKLGDASEKSANAEAAKSHDECTSFSGTTYTRHVTGVSRP